ncbi:hypothetical protein F5B20DRAFT_587679 [Whalleya microplaca]|nr:hypothetical protein F5B20DRAFT_587679 [Whalleya microplaca]
MAPTCVGRNSQGKQPADAGTANISSDDESSDMEKTVTLESINQRMVLKTAMVSNYAAQWGPIEALRELVQNWRDAIIKSFKICESDFQVVHEENDNEIVYKAVSSASSSRKSEGPQECFGYIRWSRQNGAGTIDITNRQATLQPCHLDMGGTSKQNDKTQAGAHGEGLKVSLLVFMRGPQNHAIRCRSGGFSWVFNFSNQCRLVASITRMTPAAITKAQNQAKVEGGNGLLPVVPIPNEDVHFIIGGNGRGRNENGYPTKRDEITREQFKEWTKAAIFLQNIKDEDIVRTEEGDLITDPRFSGNIYLKGLLLKQSTNQRSASITGKKLKYGYNFATGLTNRERESMAGAADESTAILSIWNQALMTHAPLIEKLHKLLNSENPEYADVSQAEYFIPSETRTRLGAYLKSLEGKWFHTAKEKSENSRFDQIIQGLGREPFELENKYWSIIKDEGFRTAEEEERKQFLAAQTVSTPEESFAKAVDRLVRAGLKACPQTAGTTTHFVKAGFLGLDSFYEQQQGTFKIHERWLTVDGARIELGMDHEVLIPTLVFNTAKRLLADALYQVPKIYWHVDPRRLDWYRKRAISLTDQMILEYTQIKQNLQFSVNQSEKLDTLVVRWNSHTGWTPDTLVKIHVHRESTCSSFKNLLTTTQVRETSMLCCSSPSSTCRSMITKFHSGACLFRGLPKEKYFAIMHKGSDAESFVILSDDPMVVETSPRKIDAIDHAKIFTLGDRVESLDMLTPRDWFQGSNPTGKEAVIGIKKEEPATKTPPSSGKPSKRSFLDSNDTSDSGGSASVRRRLF